MEKLSIPNIVLTQGETSDTFEIYSKDSLKDYKASFRITNSDGTPLKTKELSHTKQIKNQDSIFNENLILKSTIYVLSSLVVTLILEKIYSIVS